MKASPSLRSEPASRPAARRNRLWLILVLGALSAFGPLSLDMYLPALPTLADELGTGASQAQLSLTFCLLGLAAGQLLAGPLSDVHGRKGPLLLGLSVYAVTSLLCVFSPNVWVLIALRFLQGLSGAAGIVLSRAVVRDLYTGSELTRFFSMLMLVNGAAPILAPIFGGQLLKFTSWRGVFVVLCLIGIAMLIAVMAGLPETLAPGKRARGGLGQTLATFRELLGDRMFVGIALSQGLVTAGMFAYIAGSPFVLQVFYGVSEQTFSLIFALNGLGIIAAGQAAGRLAGRLGEEKLLACGLGVAWTGGAGLLLAGVLGAGLGVFLVPLFLVVSSVGIVSTAGTSLALQRYGHAAGSASALLGLLSFIFGGLISPLVGIAGSGTALPMIVLIAAAETAAVLLYLLFVRRRLG
ncbi:Bcr/CflA family drug resistance efflux transporter [Paenibacillus sp. J31TS4]|uniref:multidrug effflux MFS transporter n=1 Tax=Paenibacillus sp. J31TS4 TaxID=2807195 RepID=UPI001B07CD01|nr:multidrug effflux MFS transporter [Paenibacillus sp. J31TS4]GIP39378.1 Bcr/CflA family drug resistance efflux transporter [Paenibacillus sp. J31TS4]